VSPPARTLFLGSGSFAVPVLAALDAAEEAELVAVVTAPPRTGSRGRLTDPPVAEWAAQRDLPLLRPTRLRAPESINQIAELAPELLVLADYGQIVPATLLDLPAHGALNLHPSLLPRHRGAIPVQAAILAGDEQTGVSLMLMDAGLDTGPIVAQRRLTLDGSETAPELEAALAQAAADLLRASLGGWLAGELTAVAQDDSAASLTRPLRRADGWLDPRHTAAELERQVRAYQPWPGSYLEAGGVRIVVWRATPAGPDPAASPGGLTRTADDGLALGAADQALELIEVQPAGGRRMSGAALLRGRPGLAGAQIASSADRPS
jgi:methionyl-tRNA formyltransferase